MSIQYKNLFNGNRRKTAELGGFMVIEHFQDLSVSPLNAEMEYFMSNMGVRKRQLAINLTEGGSGVCIQAGAMQMILGNLNATSGIKGARDIASKFFKGTVTKESAVKPEYSGSGLLILEPTYKHIILQNVNDWGPPGICVEDGMFLAAEKAVKMNIIARTNISSAVAGGEGLFNLAMSGNGVIALESNVPQNELIEIVLENDVVKIDGNMAVCWSAGLNFTVEKSTNTLIGSMVSGEGLVNVYRGTGRIWISPVAETSSLIAAAHH